MSKYNPSQSKKGKASTVASLGVSTSTPTRPNGPSPHSQKKQSNGTPKTTSPVVNPLQIITAKIPAGFCLTRVMLYTCTSRSSGISWNKSQSLGPLIPIP
ncbi:hypothetical protein VP01_13239g2 [Puccinia sorghi]|uniref:Uncharacterized protein n=1 Tax=Puccinia sorghi TaxID=27349 RepID=A0A0L6VPD5_9BASI|nr:hypothetical protein VP01_13239g2 [Puccinia sorghi]